MTGGAGFIGSHLCDRLITRGDRVICVDNLFSGSLGNVEHLLGNPRFNFIRHDVTEPLHLEVEEIYNLACPASPAQYQHAPIATTKTSVYGAINMLDLAVSVGARVFQASTSEVYGDPDQHPQHESYWGRVNPIGPRACYDEGKRCAESLFFDYNRVRGLEIKVARIFNTYGPRMHPDDGRVVPSFIVRALKNEPLVLHGDGSHTRSFCFVDDLIDAIIAFMQTSAEVLGPINLGNPNEITIRELAECVVELTGSSSRIECGSVAQDDPRRRRPDVQTGRVLLGWSPTVSLRDGISRTIEYFREALQK